MPRFIGHLVPVHRKDRTSALRGNRVLAIALVLALLAASIAPSWALAREADSEAEGTAPPGLEKPDFEPGGEETALESLPASGESEGAGESPLVELESEPAPKPEPSEPAPAEVPPAEQAAELPPPVRPPAAAAPEYVPSAPDHAAPAPPAAPVENQPIAAPPTAPSEQPSQANGGHARPAPEARVPEAPSEAPAPTAPSSEGEAPLTAPAAAAVNPDAGSGSLRTRLRNRSSYTVPPGECLWWIAESLLPSGASDAKIAAEEARLWRLNATRIGTGDPNVLLVGTVLKLR